jgi:hypothetical protein
MVLVCQELLTSNIHVTVLEHAQECFLNYMKIEAFLTRNLPIKQIKHTIRPERSEAEKQTRPRTSTEKVKND